MLKKGINIKVNQSNLVAEADDLTGHFHIITA